MTDQPHIPLIRQLRALRALPIQFRFLPLYLSLAAVGLAALSLVSYYVGYTRGRQAEPSAAAEQDLSLRQGVHACEASEKARDLEEHNSKLEKRVQELTNQLQERPEEFLPDFQPMDAAAFEKKLAGRTGWEYAAIAREYLSALSRENPSKSPLGVIGTNDNKLILIKFPNDEKLLTLETGEIKNVDYLGGRLRVDYQSNSDGCLRADFRIKTWNGEDYGLSFSEIYARYIFSGKLNEAKKRAAEAFDSAFDDAGRKKVIDDYVARFGAITFINLYVKIISKDGKAIGNFTDPVYTRLEATDHKFTYAEKRSFLNTNHSWEDSVMIPTTRLEGIARFIEDNQRKLDLFAFYKAYKDQVLVSVGPRDLYLLRQR